MDELFRFQALRAPEVDEAKLQASSLETDTDFQLGLAGMQATRDVAHAEAYARAFAVARRVDLDGLLDEWSTGAVTRALAAIRELVRTHPADLAAAVAAAFARLGIDRAQLLERLVANDAEAVLADLIVALRIWNPSSNRLREMWAREAEVTVRQLVERLRAIRLLRFLGQPETTALMGGSQFEDNLVFLVNGPLSSKYLDLVAKFPFTLPGPPTVQEQLAAARALALDLGELVLRIERANPHGLQIGADKWHPVFLDDVRVELEGDYADLPEALRDVLDPDGNPPPLGFADAWAAIHRRYETFAKRVYQRIDTLVLEVGPVASKPATAGAPPTPDIAGFLRLAGVTDIKSIRHHVLAYRGAELAHIENVLEGERRSRKFRTLDHSEAESSVEGETTTTEEQEIKTEDKSSFKTSLDEVLKESIDLKVGFDLKAKAGVVEIGLNTSFAYARSKEETKKQASELARDVTNRAARKVTETVKTLQREKKIHETEETIEHGFENDKPDATNVSGLYRWVEKTYSVQQWSVPGQTRSLIDGVILQPGQRMLGAPLAQPKAIEAPPPPLGVVPVDIHPWNYLGLAARLGATVPTPPPLTSTISLSAATPQSMEHGDDKDHTYAFAQDLAVTENMAASWFTVTLSAETIVTRDWEHVLFAVGTRSFPLTGAPGEGTAEKHIIRGTFSAMLDGERGLLPCTVYAGACRGYAAALELTCVRTAEAYEAWQLSVFGALQAAHDKAMQAYDERIARAAVEQAYARGPSPGAVDAAIRAELKRSAIAILAKSTDPASFYADGDAYYAAGNTSELARRVLFFEQALEWENMTWILYPYYWADNRHDGWQRHNDRTETDTALVEFLRAGAARIVVPVRPLPEDAPVAAKDFAAYLSDAQMPALESLLDVQSPLYLAIQSELAASADADEGLCEDEWKVTVPTELVQLLPTDAPLPAWTEKLDASGSPIKGEWIEV